MIFPNLASYRALVKKISAKTHTKQPILKIAIAASYTVTGLTDVLSVMAYELGITLEIFEVPYKQYHQYIIDHKSKLYRHKSDIIFLLLDPYSLLSDIPDFQINPEHDEISARITNDIAHLIDMLTVSGSMVVFSLIPSPLENVVGVLSIKLGSSRERIIRAINTLLI